MRALMLSAIALTLAAAALPARAQSNPSTDDIIKALRPTRGIKMVPVGPTSDGSAPAAVRRDWCSMKPAASSTQ